MQHYIIVDTETTCEDTVADFGAIVCNSKGNIVDQYSALVYGQFDRVDLFYMTNGKSWSRDAASRKRELYNQMMIDGRRVMASPMAINRWLQSVNSKYQPTLTAYNLAFDAVKCRDTAIDIDQFSDKFCLWHAAVGNICNTKRYRQFVCDNHLFNKPTEKQNMTFQTNAEAVFGFINGSIITEPHTAIEDARDFELPILKNIAAKKAWREKIKVYAWQDFQVCNHFKAR